MDLRRPSSALFSTHSIALILVLLAGAYVSRTALRSVRPSVPKLEQFGPDEREVECRLWQDPIQAVYKQLDKGPAWRRKLIEGLWRDAAPRLEEAAEGRAGPLRVPILMIMTRGGVSAEGYEDRLRTRQAVLAALRRLDLKPEKTEHIDYFRVDLSADGMPRAADPNANLALVPYEWFTRDGLSLEAEEDTDISHVLLLWLRDDCFLDRPLGRLKVLASELETECRTRQPTVRLGFNVIGPTESTMLRTMLEEQAGKAGVSEIGQRIRMYSPWSTATPEILTYNLPVATDGQCIRARLAARNIDFVRMIGTDRQLVRCLVDELARRGVDVHDPSRHVVLISEWDTFYGRAFPLTFALSKLGDQDGPDRTSPEAAGDLLYDRIKRVREDAEANGNLHWFHYMRGADGKLPLPRASTPAPPQQTPVSEPSVLVTEAPERPLGRSQLDYVRRLARSLADRYGRAGGHDRLGAIGIVGSDVYDKLLLLHALREEFSNVIFFTTDLDARLMHHENFKWTRNLLVASNYGLRLSDTYQRPALRFRDNYQTAVYFACLEALRCHAYESDTFENHVANIQKQLQCPRLFEIGRDCAVDLSVRPSDVSEPSDVHPSVPILEGSYINWAVRYMGRWILAVALVLLLLVCLCKDLRGSLTLALRRGGRRTNCSERASERQTIRQNWYPAFALWAILFVLVFVLVVRLDHFRPKGERLLLWEGISVWPAEALRLVAFLLSVFFLFKARIDLDENEERIISQFFTEDVREHERAASPWEAFRQYRRGQGRGFWRPPGWQKAWRALRSYWTENISFMSWQPAEYEQAEVVCGQYLQRGAWAFRFLRVVPALALYVLLCLVVLQIFETPHCPYRGWVSLVADRILLCLSGLMMLVLIFFVVDATQLCARFIDVLKERTNWSETLDKLREGASRGKVPTGIEAMEKHYDEWLDIKLIASRTEAVGKLIYYPFIVVFVMVVARSRFFDDWNWPPSVILIFGMHLAFALYCAIRMRRSAEKARREAVRTLETHLPLLKDPDGSRTRRIEAMLDEIRAIRQGAFCSFSENPVVGALLIPSTGVTLLALLEVVG